MDMKTLQKFGLWLESEGLQAIATRVSTGDECSIIIEDCYVREQEHPQVEQKKEWKAGAFKMEIIRENSMCKKGSNLRSRGNRKVCYLRVDFRIRYL